MNQMDLLRMPSACGRDGIYIGVQLQVDGEQLRSHGIDWAADTMTRAAEHIRLLEDFIVNETCQQDTGA